MASETEIEAAAAAIANARGGRRGAPPVENVLELLRHIQGGKLYREVIEDATAAMAAAEAVREPIVFITVSDPPLQCTVNGPAHIVVEKLESQTESHRHRSGGGETGRGP